MAEAPKNDKLEIPHPETPSATEEDDNVVIVEVEKSPEPETSTEEDSHYESVRAKIDREDNLKFDIDAFYNEARENQSEINMKEIRDNFISTHPDLTEDDIEILDKELTNNKVWYVRLNMDEYKQMENITSLDDWVDKISKKTPGLYIDDKTRKDIKDRILEQASNDIKYANDLAKDNNSFADSRSAGILDYDEVIEVLKRKRGYLSDLDKIAIKERMELDLKNNIGYSGNSLEPLTEEELAEHPYQMKNGVEEVLITDINKIQEYADAAALSGMPPPKVLVAKDGRHGGSPYYVMSDNKNEYNIYIDELAVSEVNNGFMGLDSKGQELDDRDGFYNTIRSDYAGWGNISDKGLVTRFIIFHETAHYHLNTTDYMKDPIVSEYIQNKINLEDNKEYSEQKVHEHTIFHENVADVYASLDALRSGHPEMVLASIKFREDTKSFESDGSIEGHYSVPILNKIIKKYPQKELNGLSNDDLMQIAQYEVIMEKDPEFAKKNHLQEKVNEILKHNDPVEEWKDTHGKKSPHEKLKSIRDSEHKSDHNHDTHQKHKHKS